jgi:AraC-like DNA-binding protein
LLAEHRLSLVEIANELGFSDQSHFTRTFHTVVGVTPSQYIAGT